MASCAAVGKLSNRRGADGIRGGVGYPPHRGGSHPAAGCHPAPQLPCNPFATLLYFVQVLWEHCLRREGCSIQSKLSTGLAPFAKPFVCFKTERTGRGLWRGGRGGGADGRA